MNDIETAQHRALRQRAIAALVIVNLLWGMSFPAMKAANMLMERHHAWAAKADMKQASRLHYGAVDAKERQTKAQVVVAQLMSAAFLMIARFAIALVLLVVFVPRLFLGLTPERWWMGAWTGLTFAAGFVIQIVGLNYIPASRSGFLTSLSVVFTPLLMLAIERRAVRLPVAAGAAMSLLGTAVLTGLFEISGAGVRLAHNALGQIGLGDWLTAAAALIFSLQILLIDRFSRRMPAGQLTPGMFVCSLAVGLIVFAATRWNLSRSVELPGSVGLVTDWRFALLVFVMSVFCTVLAFHWMNKYQGHVSPAQAAVIYTLEPIFATGWAMFLPGVLSVVMLLDYPSERPGLELILGGLLIVAGNTLALWPRRARAATGAEKEQLV